MKWLVMQQIRQTIQKNQVNKIYLEISKLSDKFRTMCYGLTQDKEQVDDAVQECIAEEPAVKNLEFEKLDKIDYVLNDLYWYDKKVFELYYYEGNTLDSLAKKTGISRNSLFTTIDKVREILKKELTDE